MKDFRTDGQVARDKRDEQIVATYTEFRKEQPLVTRNRVLAEVGKQFGLVTQTVKGILRKYNAYV